MRTPCRAALLLLVLALGLASPAAAQDIPAHIHPLSVYQLADPTGDVAVETDPLVSQVVPPPSFDDIDVETVSLYEDFGPSGEQAGTLVILVTAAAAIQDAADVQVSFNITQGPTSLPTSTAAGRGFSFTATAVQAGSTSARISVPHTALGAVGGDLLTNLTVTTVRFDPGDLPVAQDDATGRDQAPDAGATAPAFTFFRAASASLWSVEITSVGETPGATATFAPGTAATEVTLTVTNQGLDTEGYGLTVTADPPLANPPVFTLELRVMAGGASQTRTVPISLQGVEGTVRLTFAATGERGGSGSATATLTVPAPALVPRDVVPAGLSFLTPAAEGLGFDGPFDQYAELALLALVVLAIIVIVYLLFTVASSTLKGAPADAAPALPPDAPRSVADAAPAGVLAGRPAAVPAPAAAAAPAAASPVPAGVRIASVTHDPTAPEADEPVTTEIVLRNDGSTRSVRVILSRDGADIDEATVTLPAFATKSVDLTWTAGEGENRVKVRVLPA